MSPLSANRGGRRCPGGLHVRASEAPGGAPIDGADRRLGWTRPGSAAAPLVCAAHAGRLRGPPPGVRVAVLHLPWRSAGPHGSTRFHRSENPQGLAG
ncbi:hypothetical protein Salmuc_01946 [Salipiger mucosus DSM 16094]|uniref:Uncharacterized protein n=1 Tax=Salipiger mucosus DSM 16094 TaxID=1123237 RepID=S9Q988_9RHOB|nr:hypothetical protein Salmuc_01946 [Salipiger mucosus DSM 16094]